MNKNLDRFCTDINDFEGEGIDVVVRENRINRNFLKIGTQVEVIGIEGMVEIESVLLVYEQKLYDYKGVVSTEEGERYIYFNSNSIKDYEDLLEKQQNFEESKKI